MVIFNMLSDIMPAMPVTTKRYVTQANCTLGTCPLDLAEVLYDPTLGGNVLFIALFSLLLLLQAFFGIRHRTWAFFGSLMAGLVLEVLGYVARVQLHYNPFRKDAFVMYLVCLTIGPIFFTAAIYLCQARLIVTYGEHWSYFLPRTYTFTFITSDVISLILQAAGGGIASSAIAHDKLQNGIHIMVAGLALQVVSLLCFVSCCAEYGFRVYVHKEQLNDLFADLRRTRRFRFFLYALGLATLCIIIRSCFRVAELSQGFGGKLANQQVTFMILESAMILIACICLTIFHPGVVFRDEWKNANFMLRTGRGDRTKLKQENEKA